MLKGQSSFAQGLWFRTTFFLKAPHEGKDQVKSVKCSHHNVTENQDQ